MDAHVRTTLTRWARASNRRRLAEETSAVLVWTGVAVLACVGLMRLPAFDATPSLMLVGAGGVALIATVMSARGILRYHRRRIAAPGLARRLDRAHATDDLLATAMAAEAGRTTGDEGLSAVVTSRAQGQLGRLGFPVERFREPHRALVGVGVVAAVVTLLPVAAEALAKPRETAEVQAATEAIAAPPLSEQTLEQLERDARALARVEQQPALRPEAKQQIAAIRQELGRLRGDPARSLGTLSKAEQGLRKLAQEIRDQGLHDPAAMAEMSTEQLAEQMTRALERGETDTASAMADALLRRIDDAGDQELQAMARALERALERTPPGTDASAPERGDATEGSDTSPASGDRSFSRAESERAADWRNRAEGLPERLRAGDSSSARSELRNLAEQMARRPGSGSLGESIDRTLEDVGRARTEQLSELNGDDEGSPSSPGSPDEGQGQGQGQGSPDESPGSSEGEGPPQMGLLGPPSGKPGPGGGEGSADSTPGALPQASLAAPEHVDVDPSGAPQGAIRVIRRFTQGQRDDREYQAVHGEYNAIAESAVRREEIPLTRRDYIRNYFQAVRGN